MNLRAFQIVELVVGRAIERPDEELAHLGPGEDPETSVANRREAICLIQHHRVQVTGKVRIALVCVDL